MTTVALVIGSGGARGLAHILVLEAFDELGLTPKIIAGTSMGALFGAAYASGRSAKSIRAITLEALGRRYALLRQLFAARSAPVQRALGLIPIRSALLDPRVLLDLLAPGLLPDDFGDLKIPLKVVATDLGLQEAIVLSKGPLRPAIAASIAIPVIFSPVSLQGRLLVDGALVNPLPFDLVVDDADITVAVDVSGGVSDVIFDKQPSIVDIVMQSVQILEKSIIRQKLRAQQPDIYIDVEVDEFRVLDFHRFKQVLAASAPAKEKLKRQLARVLASQTAEALPAGMAIEPPPRAPPRKGRMPSLKRLTRAGKA